ncbi:hypothetical protein HOD29_06685 [archaeon]|jgi:hypothetical protein|nr:hypothetical protein [archaeon]
MGDYEIKNIYEASYSSFLPDSASPYLEKQGLISAGEMGMTTNPMVANQLQDLSEKLSPGTSVIEIGTIQPKTWETIPKQQFEEIRRKAKLAEAEITMHAPIVGVDPAGFGQQGWSVEQRELVERQLIDVMDKAAVINKDGNLPVTIHASNFQGSTFKLDKAGKPTYEQMLVVDRKSGQPTMIKEEKMFTPGGNLEKGDIMTPEEGLRSINSSQWRAEVDGVVFKNEAAEKNLQEVYPVGKDIYTAVKTKQIDFNKLPDPQKQIVLSIQNVDAHIQDARLGVDTIFNKAWEYGDEKTKKELKKLADNYVQDSGLVSKETFEKLSHEEKVSLQMKQLDLQNQSHSVQKFAEGLRECNPKMFQRYEEFAIEKSKKTFANVAMHSYDKHGEGAPALSIENMQQGMGFADTRDLKELVIQSRKEFVDKLIEEKSIGQNEAQKIAEKLIGVTFDVGHLNISKSHGYDDKALIREAEQISKFVNKVHITDNFGFDDSHLPIGMGNVPVKEMLKALGRSGEEAVKINEVGGWFEHFKSNPFPQLLEAAGSPIYSSSSGPYWQQAGGFQQSYLDGYGQMLPQTHYSMFGAGFSQLPQDLGGAVGQGGGGRMGGGGF